MCFGKLNVCYKVCKTLRTDQSNILVYNIYLCWQHFGLQYLYLSLVVLLYHMGKAYFVAEVGWSKALLIIYLFLPSTI